MTTDTVLAPPRRVPGRARPGAVPGGPPSGPGSVLDALAPVAAVVLGVGVPLAFVVRGPVAPDHVALVLVTAVSGWRLGWTSLTSSGGFLRPFFFLYFYLFLGVAPLVQVSSGRFPWRVVPDDEAQGTASLLVLVALLAFEAGCLLQVLGGRSSRPGAPEVPAPRVRRVLDPRRVRLVVLAALVLAALAVARLGGPAALFSSRYERGQVLYGTRAADAASTDVLLSAATTAVVFVAAYCAVLVAKRAGTVAWWAVAVVSTLLAMALVNPISSARYHVGVVWGGILIALLWPLGRRKVAAVMTGFAAGLLLLFPALNAFRTSSAGSTGDASWTSTLSAVDFDSFQMTATAVAYVRDQGHQIGEQLLGAIAFWVPRSLWPGKPQGSGSLLGEHFGFPIVNLSTPLPAELYLDGGIVLVVVVLVGYGIVVSRVDRAWRGRTLSWTALFVPVVSIYQVILLRGSLLQAMMLISLIAAALWCCTRRVQEDHEVDDGAASPGALVRHPEEVAR